MLSVLSTQINLSSLSAFILSKPLPTKTILMGYGHNIQRETNNINFIDNILIGDSCWVRDGDNNIMIGKDCIIQGIYQDNDIASNSIAIGNTNETHGNDPGRHHPDGQ